jgi:hypothetical protein
MEKWDYYISGIWKRKIGGTEYISDVFLHPATNGFGTGLKTSKDEVVKLLKSGALITTITWNYHLIQWRYGEKVEFDMVDGEAILHCRKGASTFDDLESAIQMQYLFTDELQRA